MRAGVRRYSPREVARSLGLCVETVRREVRRGRLEVIRSPSGYFMNVSEDALQMWLSHGNGKRVLAHSLYCKAGRQRRKQTAPTQGKPGPGEDDT